MQIIVIVAMVVAVVALFSIRIIPQTHRGVVQRFGKYNRIIPSGLNIVVPFIEFVKRRNITERIADVEPQDIITKDNLNARVDLQIYFKVIDTEEAIKNSYYNVFNFKTQIISLAQTTARNVIGDMKFIEVNSQRNELNAKLADIMKDQIKNWGVSIVRVELKEITPPKSVQETMNQVIQAQNQKDAAVDLATAIETKADGEKRAQIKMAEGIKQGQILKAQGEAEAIRLVNEAAEKYFVGNAQIMQKLKAVENAFINNSKIIVPANASLTNVIGDLAGLNK